MCLFGWSCFPVWLTERSSGREILGGSTSNSLNDDRWVVFFYFVRCTPTKLGLQALLFKVRQLVFCFGRSTDNLVRIEAHLDMIDIGIELKG